MAERVYNVLFLCTANSARSVIAESILNRNNKGRFRAYSAGSHPRDAINPHALQLLKGLGYDISVLRSKSWNEFTQPGAPQIDFVFTVCDDAAAETCPVWPGHPMTAHWGIPDPASVQGTEAEIAAAFADTHRMLLRRIEAFSSLPMASLAELGLHGKLRDIGRMDDATMRAKAGR